MNRLSLSLLITFLLLFSKSFSQDVILTKTGLVFDGSQLIISYNIHSKNSNDQFYIWLEIQKINGELIHPKSISGDIGENIKTGNDKQIIWIPEKDSIFLNEKILIEVKAEKYIKTFKKGPVVLKSMILPGWGQSTVYKGKPWYLTGFVIYGTMVSGYLINKKSHNNYDSYKIEENYIKRIDLLETAQEELYLSRALIYSAGAAWAVNVFWVALTQNSFQPLHHTSISLNQLPGSLKYGPLLTLRFNF